MAKEYGLIIIGTGSAMNYVDPIMRANPNIRIAVIDKDEPGGICLTRGCIPSKLLIYPAEVIRIIEGAHKFGIDAEIKDTGFPKAMERMRKIILGDIEGVKKGLSSNRNITYFRESAEFIAPYLMKVGGDEITAKMFFLCTGSKPSIPAIKGLTESGYHTSDTVLEMTKLPESIAIIGGGYIAAEYGHFFSAMGSKVTVIGRNARFLPDEEPEISALAKKAMSKHMEIFTNHEAVEVQKSSGMKTVIAIDRESGKIKEIAVEEILVAAGRASNTDILHPLKGGVKTDNSGWIVVDEHLKTSQKNVWAFGDANGKYLFKHVGNYESGVVYHNAFLKKNIKADYHAVPHAVFSCPEIAAVGMSEKEATEKYGEDKISLGFERYEDTAKGKAMDLKDYFVKVIVGRDTLKILGAHIIGPSASVLIQEIVNLMYSQEKSADPILSGMHIHPALSEVVERAFGLLMPPHQYHNVLRELNLEQ